MKPKVEVIAPPIGRKAAIEVTTAKYWNVMFTMIVSRLQSLRGNRFHFATSDRRAGADQTLSRSLSIGVCVASVCTSILALMIIQRSYQDFAVARQNLYDLEEYRLVLDAANHLSAERGPSNIVMSEDPAPTGQGARRLAKARARTDAALARLAAPSDGPWGLHNHSIPPTMLTNVREQLDVARRKVDRIAPIPRDRVSALEMQDAIENMFQVVDRYQSVIAWRANELVKHDSGLSTPVLIGRMLGELREYGGRLASHLIAPVAVGEKLPLKNVISTRQSQGRILELWTLTEGEPAFDTDGRLSELRRQTEQQFLGKGGSLIEQLIAESRRGETYSLTATELTDRYVPTMKPLEAYRSAFLDAAIANYNGARNWSLILLLTAALVAAVILAILAGLIFVARIHVFGPLMHVHDEVIRLADDCPQRPASDHAARQEMLRIFNAIDLVRGRLQERAFLMNQLKAQAETDGLTALTNRRALDRIAQNETEGGFADKNVSLILIDIDHFKAVNDTHGHLAGDRALIQTAELLRSILRESDVVARFGGEEFAVLVPTTLRGAISVARKIRIALQNHSFTTPDGLPLKLTASLGVAHGRRGVDEWQELVAAADEALYRAKADGRNRVRFARPAMEALVVLRPNTMAG
ncbi:GGDEF domain-containing protein [Sinorhizobium sp. 8-89]|uniref:GGDEF domain-containing protein n=1 Tax=Sinorhizobium sp. 7-81 TaxID=3049087 RepID=UPI0024C406E8|nr:GGDEF domain-containing protein [Sinorhizobium sp. 7-81]MDK1389532.1 GGDEF domain-containing protein [Sinorhizobium sp. 7-81]